MPESITLIRPDDWHVHLRDGAALSTTVNHTARQFQRAIVMPNLPSPISTVAMAQAYRERILNALDPRYSFEPLMTLYLTEQLTALELTAAKSSGIIHGVKLYPSGATTHSDRGITSLQTIYPLLEIMEKIDLPLLVHGEVTDPEIDIFDREKIFIERELEPIIKRFPRLRIVLEHITTLEAVQFIQASSIKLAATITAHHLYINRSHLFQKGIRPHYYCLPIAKREHHRLALIQTAISANPKFFLGTDSAPHTQLKKESSCGCAGIYTAHTAMELYTQIFAQQNALDKLEAFTIRFGPQFYQLPLNPQKITLIKQPWQVEAQFPFEQQDRLIPFFADQWLEWRLI